MDGALEPAGCLGDLGWYNIRFALWAMNWQMPHAVTGRILSQSAAIRRAAPEFSGELFFDGGVSAGFYCSFLAAIQQWAYVSGQKGYLRVPDFVHPLDSYEPAFEVNDIEVRRQVAPDTSAGLRFADPLQMGHATAQDTLDVPQFCEPDFVRQAERRLADVGVENANRSGRLPRIRAARAKPLNCELLNRCIG